MPLNGCVTVILVQNVDFVGYHVRRTTITVLLHLLLPLIYTVGLGLVEPHLNMVMRGGSKMRERKGFNFSSTSVCLPAVQSVDHFPPSHPPLVCFIWSGSPGHRLGNDVVCGRLERSPVDANPRQNWPASKVQSSTLH